MNQFSSVAHLCLTLCDPWTAARQASQFISNSWSLLKLMSFMSVMPSNHLILCIVRRASVSQFSRSVVSDSLRPHELQHACPSPTPGVYQNSCPLSQLYHLNISSSVVPFSSCLQPFPTSGSFQMNQLFTCGCQSVGVSASASVLPMSTQDLSPLG